MLISISIGEAKSGPLYSVQRGISSVLNPIADGADRALKPGRDLVNWFDETFDARGQNEELEDRVADLEEENMALRDAVAEAGDEKDLEKLLAEPAVAGYDAVEASLIGRSFTAWYSAMTIDVGSSDGVAKDDAVVTAEGLVGRVSEVTGGTATVDLITNDGNAVTARVTGDGPMGSIVPIIGAPGKLDFTLIQGDKEVEDGDKLVTAGFSAEEDLAARYPADIPIGEVSEAIPAEQQQRQQVTVEPFADLSDLASVTVLTGGPS
jgi:rod shape-determining protein MreC